MRFEELKAARTMERASAYPAMRAVLGFDTGSLGSRQAQLSPVTGSDSLGRTRRSSSASRRGAQVRTPELSDEGPDRLRTRREFRSRTHWSRPARQEMPVDEMAIGLSTEVHSLI